MYIANYFWQGPLAITIIGSIIYACVNEITEFRYRIVNFCSCFLIIGFIIGSLSLLIAGITYDTMGFETMPNYEETYNLEALVDKTITDKQGVAGYFLFVGSASYNETTKYYVKYAYSNELGVRIGKVELTDNVYIKELDNCKPRIITIYSKNKSRFCGEINTNYLRTIFEVPKGTVVKRFSIDVNN